MLKKLLLILSVLCFSQTSHAYIIHAATYIKTMPGGHTQYVHLLGDLHIKKDCAQQQKDNFIQWIQRFDKQDILVITEDFAYFRPDLQQQYQQDAVSSQRKARKCFLKNLTWLCEEHNIPVYNAEFRETTNKVMDTSLDDFFTKHFIIDEIAQYDDTPLLNEYYKDVLRRIRKHEGIIETYRLSPQRKKLSLIDVFTERVIEDSCVELFDARILHCIHTHAHKKHIFVCAGATHGLQVSLMLDQLGYRQQDTTCAIEPELIEKMRDRNHTADLHIFDKIPEKAINLSDYFRKIYSPALPARGMRRFAR